MIQGIHHGLLKRLIRVVEEFNSFCSILELDNALLDYIRPQVIERSPNHIWHRSTDYRHLNHIIGILLQPIGKNNDIDLSIRKKLSRILAEHHGRHIFQHTSLARTGIQIHLIEYLLKRQIPEVLR